MPSDYTRIAEAIEYLDVHRLEQPSLEDLARHLELSPSHLQRLFTRWSGVSPKQFLQYLTLGHAKSLLAGGHSVLNATLESGLSSPGRLHDLFVSMEAVTPGEYKSRGAGIQINWTYHDSPFGDCLMAESPRGICALAFADNEEEKAYAEAWLCKQWSGARIRRNASAAKTAFKRILDHSEGRKSAPLKLLVRGTNLQVKVWEALLRIPAGEARTYEQVAAEAGNPKAVRAVGNAVGANLVSWLIPCHRVIRKQGIPGNYHWGPSRKRALLAWESAQVS